MANETHGGVVDSGATDTEDGGNTGWSRVRRGIGAREQERKGQEGRHSHLLRSFPSAGCQVFKGNFVDMAELLCNNNEAQQRGVLQDTESTTGSSSQQASWPRRLTS
jgi:hypothetical protein